jgi:hypothetical protein
MPKKQLRRVEVRKILSVYDGQVCLGVIEEGRTCLARDAEGNRVGTFANRKAALDAFFARKQPAAEAGTLVVQG